MSARPVSPIATLPLGTASLSRLIAGAARDVAIWMDRQRSRHALSRLDAHILRDIGLTQDSAAHEIGKPFWRA